MKPKIIFLVWGRVLQQAILLVGLALGFGTLLGAVQSSLQPRINENKRMETESRIPELVPGCESVETTGENYLALGGDSQLVGWVVKSVEGGFAGPVEVLVGAIPDGDEYRVSGVYVLSQTETPGLGNCIESPEWLSKFTTHPHPYRVGDDSIDGLTGATISSETVVKAVNKALPRIRTMQKERVQ